MPDDTSVTDGQNSQNLTTRYEYEGMYVCKEFFY